MIDHVRIMERKNSDTKIVAQILTFVEIHKINFAKKGISEKFVQRFGPYSL